MVRDFNGMGKIASRARTEGKGGMMKQQYGGQKGKYQQSVFATPAIEPAHRAILPCIGPGKADGL